MRTANCTKCGAPVTLNATECYNCGNNIVGEKKFMKWFIILFILAVIYVEFTDNDVNENKDTNSSTHQKSLSLEEKKANQKMLDEKIKKENEEFKEMEEYHKVNGFFNAE